MSQHGCPERLSNRSKGFQDDGPNQSTMEVLVETLTGTAFEITVLPTDTIFAIKSKIYRVEGIPVSQQHILYNLVELEDSSCLREHGIEDGARLRLVLGMRGGPIPTRRQLPPPIAEPWRDIEKLLDSNRDDAECSTSSGSSSSSSSGKVTVLVFRDGERVNMLRVKENHDGTYSPLDKNKYSASSSALSQLVERASESGAGCSSGAAALQDNAVTMTKMMQLRRRLGGLSVQRSPPQSEHISDLVDIQKTRSEESLSVPSLLDESSEGQKHDADAYAPLDDDDDVFASLYDGNYTRYEYDCSFTDRYMLLPPIDSAETSPRQAQDAAILEECLERDADDAPIQADYGPLVCGTSRSWVPRPGPARAPRPGPRAGPPRPGRAGTHSQSASSLHVAAPPPRRAPLKDAVFSSSTSDLEKLKRNTRILPTLSRHRPREHLHLSDERLDAPRTLSLTPPPEPAGPSAPPGPAGPSAPPGPAGPEEPADPPPAPRRPRVRCTWCRKRLSIATLHRCRCGAAYCAPHRYAEVHGCAYDYRAAAAEVLARENPQVLAPKLPRI